MSVPGKWHSFNIPEVSVEFRFVTVRLLISINSQTAPNGHRHATTAHKINTLTDPQGLVNFRTPFQGIKLAFKMLYIFLMCAFSFWNEFWYVPHTLALAKLKASSKTTWKKMLTLRRNIRLTSLCFLCFSFAQLSYPQTALRDHMVWTTMVKPLLTNQLGRAGSALHQVLKRAVGYRSHYNLPPLCWETEKWERSPVSCKNIIYLGCWALATSEVGKPQASVLPSGLFPKATCILEEIFASAQANTNVVCLLQLGIAKLHTTSSRMKRANKNAQLRIKLL